MFLSIIVIYLRDNTDTFHLSNLFAQTCFSHSNMGLWVDSIESYSNGVVAVIFLLTAWFWFIRSQCERLDIFQHSTSSPQLFYVVVKMILLIKEEDKFYLHSRLATNSHRAFFRFFSGLHSGCVLHHLNPLPIEQLY